MISEGEKQLRRQAIAYQYLGKPFRSVATVIRSGQSLGRREINNGHSGECNKMLFNILMLTKMGKF